MSKLKTARVFTAVLIVAISSPLAYLQAQTLDAKKLLERVSGSKVPGDHALLAKIQEKLAAGDSLGAARIAEEHPNFYNLTVKQMALRMSTREESLAIPLNDFAASFIGVTRDNLDARLLLTGNFHYRAPQGTVTENDVTRTNNHFEQLDQLANARKLNLGDVLRRVDGQLLAGTDTGTIANPDPAGVLTSRAFLGAATNAGTNRRAVEYTFKEFMCVNMADWPDTGSSDARVGRDIDRMPAGNQLNYLTTCKGCHTGMDGFRGAFARWDWQDDGGNKYLMNALVRSDDKSFGKFVGGVSKKMNGNSHVYPQGYVTADATWKNFARGAGNSALFGWRGTVADTTGGANVKSFGQLISNSKRFSQCMVKRVYEAVCRKSLVIKDSLPYVDAMASEFEGNGYSFKELFARIVVSQECNQ